MPIPCRYYFGESGRYGCVAGDTCKFSHDVADFRNPPPKQKRDGDKARPIKMTELAPAAAKGAGFSSSSSNNSNNIPRGPGSIPMKCQFWAAGGSCSLGDACPFVHADDAEQESSRREKFFKMEGGALPPPPTTTTTSLSEGEGEGEGEGEVQWELDSGDTSYFYGTPGLDHPPPKREAAHSEIAANNPAPAAAAAAAAAAAGGGRVGARHRSCWPTTVFVCDRRCGGKVRCGARTG